MMDTNRKEQMLTRHNSGTANSDQQRMPASWNQNRLTAKLGIEYPIIQGPLGGLSSQRLTSAVSNFGGLGSFGAHSLPPDAIKDVIAETRSLTSKPFAMNLWVSMEDEDARTTDENGFNRSLAPLVPEPGPVSC
jgi:nitronate monooxygenase